jgi:hypothetical protein
VSVSDRDDEHELASWGPRLTRRLQVGGGSQEVCQTAEGGVQDSAPASVRVQALGCTIGLHGSTCCVVLVLPVLLVAAIPLAVAAVSGLAKRPRSGLALTRWTRLRSSCSEEDEPQLGSSVTLIRRERDCSMRWWAEASP